MITKPPFYEELSDAEKARFDAYSEDLKGKIEREFGPGAKGILERVRERMEAEGAPTAPPPYEVPPPRRSRKPVDLASERAKRAPTMQVFAPDDCDAIVGTCIGPGQHAGDKDSRVLLHAPPEGFGGWQLTPAQALEVARQLYTAARLVEGNG